MSLLVYDLTGRATDLGITVALQFLPMLFLGAWAGAVADRRDKRTLAVITQSMLAAQAFVLGFVVLAGWASVGVIWALTLALGVLNAFENPARRGLVTELVEPRDISNATSLNTAVMTGSRIFGPALGALLVDVVGSGWCFVLNGVSFAAVLASLLLIKREELHSPPLAPRGGRPVREALSFVRGNRQLLVTLLVMTVVSTFAFNYGVSLPKLADERWGSKYWFGVMLVVHEHRLVRSARWPRPASRGSPPAGTSATSCSSASAASAWPGRRTSASPCSGRCRSASAVAGSSAPATASPSRRARPTSAAACSPSRPWRSSARRPSAVRSPA